MLGFIVFVLFVLAWFNFLWLVGRAINYAWIKEKDLPPQKWARSLKIGLLGSVILFAVVDFFDLWTEFLWFEEVAYLGVFWTKFVTQLTSFLVPMVICYWFLWLNAKLFFKLTPVIPKEIPFSSDSSDHWGYCRDKERNEKIVSWRKREKTIKMTANILIVVIAGLFGFITFSWQEVLLFLNSLPTGQVDPIFGKDISFYLFELFVWQSIVAAAAFLIIVAFFEIFILALISGTRIKELNTEDENRKMIEITDKYLYTLSGILIIVIGFAFYLGRYSLLFGDHGVFYGAGFTAVNAKIPMLNAMMVICILCSAVVIIFGFLRKWKIVFGTTGISALLAFVLLVIYPAIVQHFSVKPEELDKEMSYITNNIELTRKAYGLENIEVKNFIPNDKLILSDLESEELTLGNVRLWDWRALAATYKQTQEIRQYYEFSDLDIDRYMINEKYRSVMISPRELPVSQLPIDSQTWVNTRLKYTHGFGAVLSPVNEFTPEGMPHYYIKDIPPQSLAEVKLTQPQIYFGEMAEAHIFVNTTTEEFDYPSGEKNVFTKYDGKAGIPLDSFWRKLAFAWKFDGMPILLSDYLNEKSKVIFRRNIVERIKAIAPFLQFDEDPYFVISESETIWIIDAYTTSDNYPYSKPIGKINYIRNSVKVVVETKSGFVNFYIFDETDPILKTWQAVFPDMFLPKSQMPKELLSHIRYPEDMFRIQAKVLATYHMINPQIFYNREDLWEIAKEPAPIGQKPVEVKDEKGRVIETTQPQPEDMQSYFAIIKLPGEEKEEFLQMLPFTPATKQNMIAWLAGRCDSDDYGKLLLYQFPKDRMVFGPMMIAARMNQDKEMSSQLTLWNQQGSEVNIENILVIPVKDAILYVIPVYLQAKQSKMPELKKVVVAYGDKIVWGDSFDEALAKVFGEKVETKKEVTVRVTSAMGSESDLRKSAKIHYESYLKLTGEGKHSEAGKALEELGKILQQF